MVRNFYLKAAFLLIVFFAGASLYGQSLSGIPGMVLWLRADSGVTTIGAGDSVTVWKDLSPSGADVTSMPGDRPVRINAPTLNNKPSLKFNGHTQFLNGAPIAALNNNTGLCGEYLFVVCKADSAASGPHSGIFTINTNYLDGMWLERYSTAGMLFINNIRSNQGNAYLLSAGAMPNTVTPFKIFEIRKKQGTSVLLDTNTVQVAQILNGANGGSQMCGPFINGDINIGFAPGFSGTDGYFGGEIAEILLFDTCLSATQIQQVETYLGTKYSPLVYIGPRDTVITHSFCPLLLKAPTGFRSYLWSTGATTNSISVSTSGTYSVIIKDQFGALQYDTSTVTFPTVSLNSRDTVCSGGSLEIVPHIATFSNYTFAWSNGQTTDSISVTAASNYKVTVTDAIAHCTAVTNADVVTLDAFRNTVSLGAARTLCAGNRLSLTTPAAGWNRLLFHWSTGNTDSLIWINTPAVYSITVTDTIGCTGSASVNLSIGGTAPHVNFTTTPICQGVAYTPYNLSDSVNVHYLWAFGDGGTDTARFPSHLYHAAGTFYVKLTVTNNTGGCSNDTTMAVVVNALPAAAFQTGTGCNGITYSYINLSTAAPGQSVSSYSWNFGDTSSPLTDTSSLANPTHTYNSVDTFAVTLIITQSNGCAATATGNIIIITSSSNPGTPILQFPADGSVSASNTITFGWEASAGAEYYNLLISPDQTFSINDSSYNFIYSNQKTVTLPPNQTYYWRVTAVNPCGNATISQTGTITVFNPSSLGNLAYWIKADSGVVSAGGNVSKWIDQVRSNNDTATSVGSVTPTLLAQVPLLNNQPAVKFNGGTGTTSCYMTGNAIAALGGLGATNQNSISAFVIAKADAAIGSEPQGIFTIGGLNTGMWIERGGGGFAFINYFNNNIPAGGPTSDLNSMPAASAGPFHLFGIKKNIGSFLNIDTNGTFCKSNLNTGATGFFIDSAYNLGHCAGTDPYGGNGPYGYLNGEIAEVLIYNTLLNSAQTQQVYAYLFDKYAPPVNLGPDIVQNYSLCPVTLKTGKRFISYLWNNGATSDSLNVTQSGTYWVKVIDVFNRPSFDSIHVTLPYQGNNPDTDYVCHGDTGKIVQLISNPGQYTYTWYDSTSPSSVVNLNINANLIYPVTAGFYYTKIADSSHCSITSKKVPVIIDNFYAAQLLPLYDTLCRNGTLVTNPVPYIVNTFLWQPINDTTSAPYIPGSGTYYLSTVDNHGCKNFDSSYITTRALAPVTNFTVPNYCLSNTTYFVDSSFAAPGDSITSYFWNYGGGIPSSDTTVNGQTSYRLNYGYGNYTVVLKLTTDSGCVGIKTKHITILPSPNAGFIDSANNSVYPYILCAGSGSSAQFTDTSAVVGNSPITQRFWKFDGVVNANTNSTIQYSFPQQGNYTITLEVVNALGCADSISEQIHVNPPFTAKFSYTDQCLGDVTTFTDLTQSLSVVSRIWKFRENGDGPYAYTPTAQISFTRAATYDVELQIENAIGCLSTVDQQVKIVQKPSADFTNLLSCINQPYTPLDSSFAYGDTLVQWTWNIGGHTSNSPSPSVTFNTAGTETVSLKVTSSEGCIDSVSKVINVAPVPTALFAFNPGYGTAPLTVNFSNRSTGANEFVWDFGDGGSATTDSPHINPAPYIYNHNGNFDIVLHAYNHYGCSDSFMRLITVIPTDLDLAINQVSATSTIQPDGNALVTLSAYISNVGTRIITSAQLYARQGGTAIMEQNWTGYLLSGQTILDTFPAQFVLPQGTSNTFVCVTATTVNGGETETDTSNNENCASLSGTMQLAGPLPDPAINYAELGIILPKAGTVYVSIIDELGRPVVPEASFSLPTGRTNYTIPVAQLQGGEYFIRVRYNDDSEVRKFVVR